MEDLIAAELRHLAAGYKPPPEWSREWCAMLVFAARRAERRARCGRECEGR